MTNRLTNLINCFRTLSSEEEDFAESNIDTNGINTGMNLEEFIEHVRMKGRKGLYDEYAEIKARAPSGTFNHARSFENAAKNRYTDVLCYDHSRVLLDPEDNETKSDYINANYVDGFKQPKAFIFSQGPLPRTFVDFWQLIWEQKVMVIVMTTKTVERHRTKCGQYWPEDVGESLIIGMCNFVHQLFVYNFGLSCSHLKVLKCVAIILAEAFTCSDLCK